VVEKNELRNEPDYDHDLHLKEVIISAWTFYILFWPFLQIQARYLKLQKEIALKKNMSTANQDMHSIIKQNVSSHYVL
jgi:hypothetical protein